MKPLYRGLLRNSCRLCGKHPQLGARIQVEGKLRERPEATEPLEVGNGDGHFRLVVVVGVVFWVVCVQLPRKRLIRVRLN